MSINITVKINDHTYQADLNAATLISLPLDFEGDQVNHFEVEKAAAKSYESGNYIANCAKGGACNVETVSIIPHCHGTHLETRGHIEEKPTPVTTLPHPGLLVAKLITTTPIKPINTKDQYRPPLEQVDRVITKDRLEIDVKNDHQMDALIIRTNPNTEAKKTRRYTSEVPAAFFSTEAIEAISQLNIQHLLVDLPSVDRHHDEGMLSNHRIFWGKNQDRTLTELCYIPDSCPDGYYLLNLNPLSWQLEAVPTQAVIYPLSIK